jgi:hypothetical protein
VGIGSGPGGEVTDEQHKEEFVANLRHWAEWQKTRHMPWWRTQSDDAPETPAGQEP